MAYVAMNGRLVDGWRNTLFLNGVCRHEPGEKLIAWLNDGRSQEEALQAAFDEAIKRINATTDVAELGIIYSQFRGTDCEAEIISACGSRKQSLVGTQGNAWGLPWSKSN